ncbi:MAG: hypothetical protein DMG64_17370 [Acidobacteria bacterium]|nr:MAG: hypothetical protein DMG64_17370 [Acidobacteriota bacterium]
MEFFFLADVLLCLGFDHITIRAPLLRLGSYIDQASKGVEFLTDGLVDKSTCFATSAHIYLLMHINSGKFTASKGEKAKKSCLRKIYLLFRALAPAASSSFSWVLATLLMGAESTKMVAPRSIFSLGLHVRKVRRSATAIQLLSLLMPMPSAKVSACQNNLAAILERDSPPTHDCCAKHAQLGLSPGVEFAPDSKLTAHELGAFVHAGQTVTYSASVSTKDFRVNAFAVVADA